MPSPDTRRTPGAESLGAVLGAVADPTRRRVFEYLSEEGPLSATDLAERLPISRQAVAKHLAALADAGLARSERSSRQVVFSVVPDRLTAISEWMEKVGRTWDRRLIALEKLVADPRE